MQIMDDIICMCALCLMCALRELNFADFVVFGQICENYNPIDSESDYEDHDGNIFTVLEDGMGEL